jgi:hypothetical protein
VDEAGNSLLKPFIKRSVAPDPTKYDKRVMPGQDPGTIVVNTTSAGVEAGTIIDPAGSPKNAYEMTVNSRASYVADLMAFNTRLVVYQYKTQCYKELKHWVLNTVSTYILERYCRPDRSIRVWYDNMNLSPWLGMRPAKKPVAAISDATHTSENTKVE